MLNQIVLVGRVVSDPEMKKLEDGKRVCNITLAIPRSYKNNQGEYDTDFVDCVLWNNIAYNTTEYCKKGDLVGVKGRIQTDTYEVDGEKRKKTSIVAEKVTFLSSKARNVDEEVENEDKDIDM